MSLHESVLAHRRKAIIFNSTSMPSQFNYMFGMAVELAARKDFSSEVDIYFMTDDTRSELISSTPGLKFLSLGPKAQVQSDLSSVMSNARSAPRDPVALARISKGFWADPQVILTSIERSYLHLKEIRPMLVVLDQFSRALDGAMALRIPYLMCGNEVVPTSKPTDRSALQAFFTVPSMCTGFVGPMSWTQMFKNTTVIVSYLTLLLSSSAIRSQASARRQLLNEPKLPFATLDRSFGSDLEHGEIWAMPRSILHPHARYDTVFPVGPTFVAQFEENVETNLASWLDEGPVVYINMGTLFKYTDADLHTFAQTMLNLAEDPSSTLSSSSHSPTPLITRNKHRFLWKLPQSYHSSLLTLFPSLSKHPRIRIESWVDYPHLLLQHPSVLAFVHHGGANSFVESGWYGVPQVVMPMWADCYDTAAQVERLGLGVSSGEREAPRPGVHLFEGMLRELLSTGAGKGTDEPSSLYEHEKLEEKLKGWMWYKANAERFAEECRLAGGAGAAADIIQGVYEKELGEWDGPASA